MKRRRRLLVAGVSGLLTAVLIVLVRVVDVRAIGPDGTRIGLSGLNRFVFETLGVHMFWYEVTDWLGIASVGTALLFALMGLIQWIRRKSLRKNSFTEAAVFLSPPPSDLFMPLPGEQSTCPPRKKTPP